MKVTKFPERPPFGSPVRRADADNLGHYARLARQRLRQDGKPAETAGELWCPLRDEPCASAAVSGCDCASHDCDDARLNPARSIRR